MNEGIDEQDLPKYTETDMVNAVRKNNKDWIDFYEKKEKRDFKVKIGLIIIVALWISGYWLVSPSKNKIVNTGTMNDNTVQQNNE